MSGGLGRWTIAKGREFGTWTAQPQREGGLFISLSPLAFPDLLEESGSVAETIRAVPVRSGAGWLGPTGLGTVACRSSGF